MTDNITGDTEIPERATSQTLSGAHPMLAVSDVDVAIEHYRTVLGFFVEWAHHDESGSARIANLWRGQLSIFLMGREGFGPSCVYCHLGDRVEVDALYTDLVEAGANITESPADRPWGLYEMRFVDLDNNEFRIACSSEDDGDGH